MRSQSASDMWRKSPRTLRPALLTTGVEPAVVGGDRAEQRRNVLAFCDIASERVDIISGRGQRRASLVDRALVNVGQIDDCAFLGEQARGFQPNPCRCTGYQRNPATQSFHRLTSNVLAGRHIARSVSDSTPEWFQA